MKHFLCKTASSELWINYPDTGNNTVRLEHAALTLCGSYRINISSIIPSRGVTEHFFFLFSLCIFSWQTISARRRSDRAVAFWVNQTCVESDEARVDFLFRTRTVFKWEPQAVQTRWQCKWLLLMTDSPLPWLLIKNSSFLFSEMVATKIEVMGLTLEADTAAGFVITLTEISHTL